MSDLRFALDTRGASAFTRISVSLLTKMRMRDGKRPPTIPSGPRFCCVGRKVVYLRADLEAWLSSLRTSSSANGKRQRGPSGNAVVHGRQPRAEG